MALSNDLLQVARNLRVIRPPVLPGSNVIADGDQRTAFYAIVYALSDGIRDVNDARRFFDVAGIPD